MFGKVIIIIIIVIIIIITIVRDSILDYLHFFKSICWLVFVPLYCHFFFGYVVVVSSIVHFK